MDVTHFSEFGKLQFVHVSEDTASGVLFASLHTGEKACHVIAHFFEAWCAWDQPRELKTENGPAYTSASFVSFCKMMGVHLVHGIPYNPQGQGIIKRAHCTP
jgi:transposase InsO family protein